MTKSRVKPIIIKIQDVVFWFNRNTNVDCAISFNGNRFIIDGSQVNHIINCIDNFSSVIIDIYGIYIEVFSKSLENDDWRLCFYKYSGSTKTLMLYHKVGRKELVLFFNFIKYLIETTDANGYATDTHKTKS